MVAITLANGDMKGNESCTNFQHSLGSSITGPLILLGTDGIVMTGTTLAVTYQLETFGKFMFVNHLKRKKRTEKIISPTRTHLCFIIGLFSLIDLIDPFSRDVIKFQNRNLKSHESSYPHEARWI